MKIHILTLAAAVLASALTLNAKTHELKSPDGKTVVKIQDDGGLKYSVTRDETLIFNDASLSMEISDGTSFGAGDKVKKVVYCSVSKSHDAFIYKKSAVEDEYNGLRLVFKSYDLEFRAYDEGVAYRFISKKEGKYEVVSEKADFRFAKDWKAWIPYICQHTKTLDSQFYNSFENVYEYSNLSQWRMDRMAFLPITVDADGKKVCITETDLRDYPGMNLYKGNGEGSITGRFARYPKTKEQGGHNMLQMIVTSTEDYIAKAEGPRTFPWRIAIIADEDKDLLDSDLAWTLAEPAEGDYSWVRPGKVAWDWWNNWNLYGVDFKAGINNDTYKYYIDFASAHGIEYVILDEGWSVNLKADLMQVVPEINLEELVEYANSKNVGLILWAGYKAFDRDMENVCKTYSEMGIKGFKVDFMDRDDAEMLAFYERAAKTTAKYRMLVDFHGAFKPIGLQRKYPNVINHEGVYGLENRKWDKKARQVDYDVTFPYIRMVAGPVDYTQGAMRNATKKSYVPNNAEPMSEGTRCRQLAEYVIFLSPLNMLCDSPSNYLKEEECVKFIADCPETWDETVAIDGKIGEYIVVARRKGETWYIGAITDWNSRDITISTSFLPEGCFKMDIFEDGPNAEKAARDYAHKTAFVNGGETIRIHLAPGGGWAAALSRQQN